MEFQRSMEDWQDDLVPEKDSTEPTVATEKPLKQNFKKSKKVKIKGKFMRGCL